MEEGKEVVVNVVQNEVQTFLLTGVVSTGEGYDRGAVIWGDEDDVLGKALAPYGGKKIVARLVIESVEEIEPEPPRQGPLTKSETAIHDAMMSLFHQRAKVGFPGDFDAVPGISRTVSWNRYSNPRDENGRDATDKEG